MFLITALIEELDAKPIADIAKKLGGWPVIEGESWDADNSWSWQETVKKFRKMGFSMDYIIDFSISVDLKNSTTRIIDVSWSAHLEFCALLYSLALLSTV